MGFTFWNQLETLGAFILALGILLFLINAINTARKPRNAPLDPWDARSYEWMTSSPPKQHNFDAVPTVHTLDEFFHRKYDENDAGELVKVATAEEILAEQEENADEHIHLPSPSYWPIVLAAGLPVIGIGLIFSYPVAVVGGVIVLFGSFGWALEPSVAPDAPDEGHAPPPKELSTVG
jgi:cytochrome c oxidase subunit 1